MEWVSMEVPGKEGGMDGDWSFGFWSGFCAVGGRCSVRGFITLSGDICALIWFELVVGIILLIWRSESTAW